MNGDRGKKGFSVGEFDRKITIEQPTWTTDTTGERRATWGTLVTAFAIWKPMSSVGSERYENNEHVETITGFFTVRYRDDITAEMRIVEGSNTFAIKAVGDASDSENVPRKQWTKIKVTKKDNNNNSK